MISEQTQDLPSFAIIVPSWNRPAMLRDCLGDLLLQDYVGHIDIVLVLRVDDSGSRDIVASFKKSSTPHGIRIIDVFEPGFVRALRTGFVSSESDCVAFCDDDARYPKNWIQMLAANLTLVGSGGAGGPIREKGAWQGTTAEHEVASIRWTGRMLYRVRAQPKFTQVIAVDSLPGANMAYWRKLIDVSVLDMNLDGRGFSPGNEMAIGWSIRNLGYALRYDPSCVVDHFSADWVESDRTDPIGLDMTYGHNLCYVFWRFASIPRCFLFTVIFILLGQRVSPGPLFPARLGGVHGRSKADLVPIIKAKLLGCKRGYSLRHSRPA